MKYIKFQDKKGTFTIQSPENYSGLYFPLAGDGGLKSSIRDAGLQREFQQSRNYRNLQKLRIKAFWKPVLCGRK